MRDTVPSTIYSSICNVLRQWRIWLIPTYRVYRLYDNEKHLSANPRRNLTEMLHVLGEHTGMKTKPTSKIRDLSIEPRSSTGWID